jgi:endonuclease-8
VPEGDTIFRAARTLRRAFQGKQVTRFETALAQLARVDDQSSIAGRTIEDVQAVGKHLLIRFSGDLWLRTHMRMNGSWHIYRHGERWQKRRADMRVIIESEEFVAIAFNVPIAEFRTTAELQRDRDITHLGPDLLGNEFDLPEALRRARLHGSEEIANVLLNQSVAAGVGNVFKSEVLFLCAIHPAAPVARVTDEELQQLLTTSRTLMQQNVIDGKGDGIVTYTGFRRTTRRADPSERLWVYGRRGEGCRKCGTPIEYRKQGPDARSTYWCPKCQPER